ncbi:helix-turn-helix transcriptional regulator [Streptomyces tibetensis]|uniref:helix-turn-helix transcriptional regulator n=1 Tax=Streptomyces tibetensis TaxID=2382123 RepID=UPI0034017AF1
MARPSCGVSGILQADKSREGTVPEQQPERALVPPRRGLAPLSDELQGPERAFAEHLRGLRESAGMTSADLAAALGVDATRLSRYLSGQSLPEPQLLTRLHLLLADQGEEPSIHKASRESRALLYAAARSKGPLSARAYEVAELQEKLNEQQTETARSLAQLRDELRLERDRRRQAEEEIVRLRQANATERDEEVRRLAAERDGAVRRAAELEDRVTQTEALLRLQQEDARHAKEMAEATADEVLRWEGEHETDPDGGQQQKSSLQPELVATSPHEAIELMTKLRDQDENDAADGLIRQIVRSWPPDEVAALYAEFPRHGRRLEALRLLDAAARHCDGPRLRDLLLIRTQVYRAEPDFDEKPLGILLASKVGSLTPVAELVRVVRYLRERSQEDRLEEIASAASYRPRTERRQLNEAGLLVTGPLASAFLLRRPRPPQSQG